MLYALLWILCQLISAHDPISSLQKQEFLVRHQSLDSDDSQQSPDFAVDLIRKIQNHNLQTFQRQYDLTRKYGETTAMWPCLWGMEAITTSNEESSVQWGCGIAYLQEHHNEECVVYSFRSQHQGSDLVFESRISESLSECQVHIFRSVAADNDIVIDSEGGRVTMHQWNGGESLSNIMDRLGHSHLDILNVNTDREQSPIFFAVNPPDHWPSIGQMNLRMKDPAPRSVITFLENQSLRIYNIGSDPLGITFAFIQKEWSPNQRQYIGMRSVPEPSEPITVLEVDPGATVQDFRGMSSLLNIKDVSQWIQGFGAHPMTFMSAIPKTIYIVHKYDLCDVTKPSHLQHVHWEHDRFHFQLMINVQKIKALHPDYKVICYDDDSAYDYILNVQNDPIFADYFRNEHTGSYKSDLFRIFLLFHEGGYYFDSDMEPRMSLNEVISSSTGPITFISAISEDKKAVFQSILGATKGNPILKQNLDIFRDYYSKKKRLPNNMGTVFLCDAVKQYIKLPIEKVVGEIQIDDQILRFFEEKKYEGVDAVEILSKRIAGKSWDYIFGLAVYDPVSNKYPFWSRFTGYCNAWFRTQK